MSENPITPPAVLYERDMVPAMFLPWAIDLVDRMALSPGERVLDVGCGTGVVARLAAQGVGPAGEVAGVDSNPSILAVARKSSSEFEGITEWYEGSADDLPFANATFDVVLSQQAYQFFPDQPSALRERRRVLSPGGRVAVSVWRHIDRQPHYVALVEALGTYVSADAADLMRAPFIFTDAEQLEEPLSEAEFQDVVVQLAIKPVRFPSPAGIVRSIVAGSILARSGVEVPEEALDAICADVTTAMKPYIDDGALAVPTEAYVAVARS